MEDCPTSPLFRLSFQTSSINHQQKSDSEETFYEPQHVPADRIDSTESDAKKSPVCCDEGNYFSFATTGLSPAENWSPVVPMDIAERLRDEDGSDDNALDPANQMPQSSSDLANGAAVYTVESNDFGDSQWLTSFVHPERGHSVDRQPNITRTEPSDSQLCLSTDIDDTQWQMSECHVKLMEPHPHPSLLPDSFENELNPARKGEMVENSSNTTISFTNDEMRHFPSITGEQASLGYRERDMLDSNQGEKESSIDCPETNDLTFSDLSSHDLVPIISGLNFGVGNEPEVKYDLCREVEQLLCIPLDDLNLHDLKEDILPHLSSSPRNRHEGDRHESNLSSTEPRDMKPIRVKLRRGKPPLKTIRKKEKTKIACHAMTLRAKKILQEEPKSVSSPLSIRTRLRKKDIPDLKEEGLVSYKKHSSVSRFGEAAHLDEIKETATPGRKQSKEKIARKTPNKKSTRNDRVSESNVRVLEKRTPRRRCDLVLAGGSSSTFSGDELDTKSKTWRSPMKLRRKTHTTRNEEHKQKSNCQRAPSKTELSEIEERLRQIRDQIDEVIFADTPTIISNETARKMRTIVQKDRERLEKWNIVNIDEEVTNRLRDLILICETLLYQLGTLMSQAEVQDNSGAGLNNMDTNARELLWNSGDTFEYEAVETVDRKQVNNVVAEPSVPCEKCSRHSNFQIGAPPSPKVLLVDGTTNTCFKDFPGRTHTKILVDRGTNTDFENITVEAQTEKKEVDCAVNTDFDLDEGVRHGETDVRIAGEVDKESLPELDLRSVTGIWLPHPSEYFVEPEAIRIFLAGGCAGDIPAEMLDDFEWD